MSNPPTKISFTSSRSPFYDGSATGTSGQPKVQAQYSASIGEARPLFDTAPETPKPAAEPMPASEPKGQAAAESEANAHWKATPPKPATEVADPQWHAAIEPNPFRDPAPKAPGFAATGLMASQETGVFQRHGSTLAIAAVVLLTFCLGLGTAIVLLGDQDGVQTAGASATAPLPVQETPTRSVTPDLTQISSAAVAELTAAELAQSVLSGLTPNAQAAARSALEMREIESLQVLNDVKMRMLREGVLAGLYEIVTVEQNGTKRTQLQMINAQVSSGFEDAILIEAAEAGRIDLARALRTPQGGLDVTTMIFNLVHSSLMADDQVESTQAARDMSRRVFAASVARTEDVQGVRIYTVQPGDSLAYISLQFFGKPSEYKRILDANRETLHSPDQIQIGQRIIIPS